MEPSKPEHDSTAFQVKRAILLADAQPEKVAQAVQTLRAIKWLSDVHADGQRLSVRYDASGANFSDLEQLLDEAGLHRPTSLWWRFKSALYRFLDANVKSNALSGGGACCNRPPSPK